MFVGLTGDDGVWREDRTGMEDSVVSYFLKLFTSNGVENFNEILCHITPSVIEEMR